MGAITGKLFLNSGRCRAGYTALLLEEGEVAVATVEWQKQMVQSVVRVSGGVKTMRERDWF
jgi:hypothetical protein